MGIYVIASGHPANGEIHDREVWVVSAESKDQAEGLASAEIDYMGEEFVFSFTYEASNYHDAVEWAQKRAEANGQRVSYVGAIGFKDSYLMDGNFYDNQLRSK